MSIATRKITILMAGTIFFAFFLADVGWGQNKIVKLGASRPEIIDIMGPPIRITPFTSIEEEIWWYPQSSLTFKRGKLENIQNSGDLRNGLEASLGDKTPGAPPFKAGSTKEEVIAAQGSPSRVSRFEQLKMEIWSYGLATVTFRNERVAEWLNIGSVLNIDMGKKNPDASPFAVGSSKEDVLASEGTPKSVKLFPALKQEIWFYGFSTVTFIDGAVVAWNNQGQLFQNAVPTFRGTHESDGILAAESLIEVSTKAVNTRNSRYRGLFQMDETGSRPAGSDSTAPNLFQMETGERSYSGHTVRDIFQTGGEQPASATQASSTQPVQPASTDSSFRGLLLREDDLEGRSDKTQEKSKPAPPETVPDILQQDGKTTPAPSGIESATPSAPTKENAVELNLSSIGDQKTIPSDAAKSATRTSIEDLKQLIKTESAVPAPIKSASE
ncbi:MAG: hypothetical protein AB1656_07995 [Candidatus Omnitrophota bacterium]